MNIYEITGQLLELQEMLLEDPESQVVIDTLESVQYDLADKSEGYVMVMRNLQAKADAYKAEIDRMTDRKRSIENNIQRMKDTLQKAMEATETDKIEGNLFTISMRNKAPQLPKEIDLKDCPVAYLVEQEPKIDRVGLLKAVKSGEVKGIELVTGRSLTIK